MSNKVEFTEDEIVTIKTMIEYFGWEYGLQTLPEKVVALAEKLGMDDYVKRYRNGG